MSIAVDPPRILPMFYRFVERMLTVVATCRQQGWDVREYLASCFEAARDGRAIPSPLPAGQPKVNVA